MPTLHPVAALITSTGLRRAALHHDMTSAINRWQLSKNGDELEELTEEQLYMLIVTGNAGPGHPLWTYTERRTGWPLPTE